MYSGSRICIPDPEYIFLRCILKAIPLGERNEEWRLLCAAPLRLPAAGTASALAVGGEEVPSKAGSLLRLKFRLLIASPCHAGLLTLR